MPQVLIYTTSACHLCEVAQAMISPILEENNLQLELVEVSDSDALIERYGLRIPVVQLAGDAEDLAWPFSELDFVDYLNSAWQRVSQAPQ